MISFGEIDRPSLNEICNDNWFNDIINLSEEERKLLDLELKNEFLLHDH